MRSGRFSIANLGSALGVFVTALCLLSPSPASAQVDVTVDPVYSQPTDACVGVDTILFVVTVTNNSGMDTDVDRIRIDIATASGFTPGDLTQLRALDAVGAVKGTLNPLTGLTDQDININPDSQVLNGTSCTFAIRATLGASRPAATRSFTATVDTVILASGPRAASVSATASRQINFTAIQEPTAMLRIYTGGIACPGASRNIFQIRIRNVDPCENFTLNSLRLTFTGVSNTGFNAATDLASVSATDGANTDSTLASGTVTLSLDNIAEVVPPLSLSDSITVSVLHATNLARAARWGPALGGAYTVEIDNINGTWQSGALTPDPADPSPKVSERVTVPRVWISDEAPSSDAAGWGYPFLHYFIDSSPSRGEILVGPNSDITPLMGIRAGGSGGSGQAITRVDLTFFQMRGKFTPGGFAGDDFGDLDLFLFLRTSDLSFDATGNRNSAGGNLSLNGEETIDRLLRVNMAPGGAEVVDAGVVTDTFMGPRQAYRLSIGAGFGDPAEGASATANVVPAIEDIDPTAPDNGPNFVFAFETNRKFSDDPNFNGVGMGDGWVMHIDTVQVCGCDVEVDTNDPIAYSALVSHGMTQFDTANVLVPVHLSNDTADLQGTGYDDLNGLDYLAFTPIFGFHVLGGSTQDVAQYPDIREITLQLDDPTNRYSSFSDLPIRPVNSTAFSGFQLRRNRDAGTAIYAIENADSVVPLVQATFTNVVGGPDTITLRYQPDILPNISRKAPSVAIPVDMAASSLDNIGGWTDATTDVANGNPFPNNNEYWLGVFSDRAQFGDTLTLAIPPRGILFSNNVRSDSTFTSRSRLFFGPPILAENLVATNQTLGESSPPTALLRFRMDGNRKDERLGAVYVYFIDTNTIGGQQLDETDFRDSDGMRFTNAVSGDLSASGVAIYRDMNGNAVFEAGTDTFVPFLAATLLDPTGTRFTDPGVDVNLLGGRKALLARMYLDLLDPRTWYGATDTAVFFVVVRSSGTINADDRFFAVLGDLDEVVTNGGYQDGEGAGIWVWADYDGDGALDNFVPTYTVNRTSYNVAPFTGSPFVTDMVDPLNYGDVDGAGWGFGWRREDHYRGKPITGESIREVVIDDLTAVGQTVFAGQRLAVLGINIRSGSVSQVTLDTLAVIVEDSGTRIGDFATSDISSISATTASGVAVFSDGGDSTGQFDSADTLVALLGAPAASAVTNGTKITFGFSPPIIIPADDAGANAGDDIFIVLNISNTITFRDDFAVSIPQNAFGFSTFTTKQPDTEATAVLTAGMPVFLTAVGDTFINTDSTPIWVIGIDAADTIFEGPGRESLTIVKVTFETISGFTLNDLRTLTTDTYSGVALFRDDGTSQGAYDPPWSASPDALVPLAAAPASAGFTVTIAIPPAVGAVPDGNAGNDTGPDWWVVLRASSTADTSDKFRATIASAGLTWSTQFVPDATVRSGVIQCTGVIPGRCLITGKNPFSPDGLNDRGAETSAITTSALVDTFLRIQVFNLSGLEVIDTSTIARAFTIVLDQTSGLPQAEYICVTTADSVTPSVDTNASYLFVDTTGVTPQVTFSQSGAQITLTIVVDLTTSAGADSMQTSYLRAGKEAERDSWTVILFQGDSEFRRLTGTNSTQTKTATITIPEGIYALKAVLEDNIGNRSDTVVLGSVNTSTSGGLTVSFEGNSPVFFKSPSNPAFTFTFPSAAASGAYFEVYNYAGNRLRRLPIAVGVTQVDWDGTADDGRTLRNGVYLLKFHVPLGTGGTAIEERRTIVLMK